MSRSQGQQIDRLCHYNTILEVSSKTTVFVAIKGGVFDGHAFISKAIEQGAAVVVCEDLPLETVDTSYLCESRKYEQEPWRSWLPIIMKTLLII